MSLLRKMNSWLYFIVLRTNFVSNHKLVSSRTGKVVKLDVSREAVDTEPVEEVLPGRYSVFNLDPKVSKIFVGGIPAGVEVDRSILSTSYDGEIEDLRLNDQFIGLWNFMSSGTNNNYQRGAMERLVNSNLVLNTPCCWEVTLLLVIVIVG